MTTDVTTQSIAEKISTRIIPITLIGVGFTVMAAAGLFFFNKPVSRELPNRLTCATTTETTPTADPVIQGKNVTKLRDLNGQLKTAVALYRQSKSQTDAERLQALLKERKPVLVQAMTDMPDQLAGLTLPFDDLTIYNQLTSGCIEYPTGAEGVVSIRHIDDLVNQQAIYAYTLSTTTEKLQLNFVQIPTDLSNGSVVRMTGTRLGDRLLAESTVTVESPAKPAQPVVAQDGVRHIKILAILFYSGASVPASPTVADYRSMLTSQVRSYYWENSYHQVQLEGVRNPSEGADVVGWVKESDALQGATNLAQANGHPIDFRNYDLVIEAGVQIGNEGGYCCDVGILTPDGYTNASFITIAPPVVTWAGLTEHEIGHYLGLQHAASVSCTLAPFRSPGASCSSYAYGDPYDVMGVNNQVGGGHFNARHKELLTWLKSGNLETVIGPTSVTRDLEPLETNTNGLKILKIPRAPNDAIYVEYRQADQAGAIIHFSTLTYPVSTADTLITNPDGATSAKTLPPGSSYTDSPDGIMIKTLSPRISGKLTVQVDFLANYDVTPPVLAINAPAANATVSGGAVPVTATVTDDGSGVSKVEFRVTQGNYSNLFRTMTAPTSGTTWQTALDSIHVPNGDVTLTITAYDQHGNTAVATRHLTVQNNDTTLPTVTIAVPSNEQIVNYLDLVIINANVNDNNGVLKAEFYRDVEPTPFATYLNPSLSVWTGIGSGGTGEHVFRVKVYDFAGNIAEKSVMIIAKNLAEPTPPTVTVTNPTNNATVTGMVTMTVNASDAAGIQKVEWFIDGTTTLGTVTTSPYSFTWDSTAASNATHTLKAKAWDNSGNSNTSQITVTVSNVGGGGGCADENHNGRIDPGECMPLVTE